MTITGTNFTGATEVDFGANAATNLNVINDTTITVDNPAGTGLVDVTVTNRWHVAYIRRRSVHLRPGSAPTVTGINPNSGPGPAGRP